MHYCNIVLYLIGVDGQNVTIVTDPPGIPVDNQPNTYDYPILSNVTLMCIVTGSSDTVTSYYWTRVNCYSENAVNAARDSCFYDSNPTGQNITSGDRGVVAKDAGTVTCTATINGVNYTSDPLTLRISGEQL